MYSSQLWFCISHLASGCPVHTEMLWSLPILDGCGFGESRVGARAPCTGIKPAKGKNGLRHNHFEMLFKLVIFIPLPGISN